MSDDLPTLATGSVKIHVDAAVGRKRWERIWCTGAIVATGAPDPLYILKCLNKFENIYYIDITLMYVVKKIKSKLKTLLKV